MSRSLWSVPCPRHRWPELHTALTKSKKEFTTGHVSDHVEILVDEAGLRVAQRFGLEAQGRNRDPWSTKLEPGAGVTQYKEAQNAPPEDPLEVAFRRMRDEMKRRDAEAA